MEKKKFKRTDFKATSTKSLAEVKEVEDEEIGSSYGDGDTYHKLEDGINKFRVYPKFPGEKTFYKKKSVFWVTVQNDDGKETRRPIFNSKYHSGENFDSDIIKDYLDLVQRKLKKANPKKVKEVTDALKGQKALITEKTNWILFADRISKNKKGEETKTFGLLEFSKSVRNAILDACIIEDEDEAIDVDPFTDPDEGQLLLITKDSEAKDPNKYYKLSVSKTKRALSDEELDLFSEQKSLTERLDNCYTRKEFEKALEGIEFFDERFDLGIFESSEFVSLVEKYSDKFDEIDDSEDDEEEEEKPKKKSQTTEKKKAPKKVVEEEEEEDDEEEEEVVKPTKKKTVAKKVVEEDDGDDDDDDDDDEDWDDEEDEEEKKPKGKTVQAKKPEAKKVAKKVVEEDDDDDEDWDDED